MMREERGRREGEESQWLGWVGLFSYLIGGVPLLINI
jgi:hypothetical protein